MEAYGVNLTEKAILMALGRYRKWGLVRRSVGLYQITRKGEERLAWLERTTEEDDAYERVARALRQFILEMKSKIAPAQIVKQHASPWRGACQGSFKCYFPFRPVYLDFSTEDIFAAWAYTRNFIFFLFCQTFFASEKRSHFLWCFKNRFSFSDSNS